jgi:hypothetical protein
MKQFIIIIFLLTGTNFISSRTYLETNSKVNTEPQNGVINEIRRLPLKEIDIAYRYIPISTIPINAPLLPSYKKYNLETYEAFNPREKYEATRFKVRYRGVLCYVYKDFKEYSSRVNELRAISHYTRLSKGEDESVLVLYYNALVDVATNLEISESTTIKAIREAEADLELKANHLLYGE